jgi:UDP-N-acetyl-D-mannosaminuronate dehydrogenase
VVDIVRELQSFGVKVQVQDPLADPAAARREYGIIVRKESEPADAVIVAVAHEYYRQSGWALITPLLKNGRGLVIDVKGVLDIRSKPADIENLATLNVVRARFGVLALWPCTEDCLDRWCPVEARRPRSAVAHR